jgi:hypothetical protein
MVTEIKPTLTLNQIRFFSRKASSEMTAKLDCFVIALNVEVGLLNKQIVDLSRSTVQQLDQLALSKFMATANDEPKDVDGFRFDSCFSTLSSKN